MEYQLLMDQLAVDNKILLTQPIGTVPVLTLSITGHISCLHSFRITTSVTGNPGPGYSLTDYYTTDPLWDGAGCGPNNACCQFNNPPWFKSSLPLGTSDDIEIRICHGESSGEQ